MAERAIRRPAQRGEQAHDGRSAMECHRDELYRRLEDGYQKVERGLTAGSAVTRWEDLWIKLLREYEGVCDTLDRDLAA